MKRSIELGACPNLSTRATKSLVLLSLLVLSLEASAKLPDEIDYPTYLTNYNHAKGQSDNARTRADEIKSLIHQLAAEIESNAAAINFSKQEIDGAIAVISDLSMENMDLENTMAMLKEENLGLTDELDSLASRIAHLVNKQNSLERELQAPTRRAYNLRNALESVRKNLKQNGEQLSRVQKKLERNRKEIQVTEANIKTAIDENDRLKLKLPKLQSEIKQKKDNRDKASQKIVTLKAKLEVAKALVVSRQQDVAGAQQRVSRLQDKIEKQETKITPLIQKRKTFEQELGQVQSSTVSLEQDLEKAKSELASAKSQLSTLKNEKEELAKHKENLAQKNARLESDLATVEETLKELMANRDRTNASKIKNLREQRRLLRNKIAQTGARLNKIDADLKKVSEKLSQAQDIIAQGDGKIASLRKKVRQSKTQAKELSAKLEQLRIEIAQAAPQLDNLKKRLANAKKELSEAQNLKSVAQEELQAKQSLLAQVRADIKRLEDEIASLIKQRKSAKERIAIIDQDLVRLKRHLKQQNDEFIANRRVLGTVRSAQNALKVERDSYARRLSLVEEEIGRFRAQLDELQAQSLVLEEERKQRQNQYGLNLNRMNQAQQRLESNSFTISQKQVTIADNDERLQNLELERGHLLESKLLKEEAFAKAHVIAGDLERLTQEKYEAYKERKELYGDYKDEAFEMGARQGEAAGATAGEYEGASDVQKDAAHFGGENGTVLGKLRAYLTGLISGRDKGLEQGYETGRSSNASYEKGHLVGYKEGVEQARDLAKKESFPQGYKAVKEEKFSTFPSNKVVLENSVKGSLFLEKAFLAVSEVPFVADENFEYHVPEYVSQDEREQFSLRSKVDQEISQVRSNIVKYESNDMFSKAKAQYVYTAPTMVDIDEDYRNCEGVYKGISAFVEACEKSYELSYKEKFVASHKETFFSAYEELFTLAQVKALGGDFSSEEKKASDKAYQIAFNEARLEGEGIAYKNGVNEGKELGFEENIESLRQEQLAKGRQEASKLFSQSGVIRLNKFSQTNVKTQDKRGLIQDSKFSVGLGLVNFGELASRRGAVSARVISATSNISVQNGRANLRVLPASSQIELSDVIQAKVLNNARVGDEVQMKIELTYPGDDLRPSYKEVAVFNSHVMVNPEVGISLDFDNKVKDRKCVLGIFNCKYRSHDVRVNLTGLRDYVPGHYDVAISVLEGGKFIKFKTAHAKVAAPGAGVNAVANLTYKFKKKTKDDRLKFRVDVSYEGEILQSKVISVKAK